MTSLTLIAPIYFWTPVELEAFRSVRDAEFYLEPEDVKRGSIGQGFDSAGTVVQARLNKEDWLPKVELFPDPDRRLSMEDMQQIFIEFLRACDYESDAAGDLTALIAAATALALTR